MTLFEECIIALGNDVEILSQAETSYYFDELVKKFPVTSWARIDWNSISIKKPIEELGEIIIWLNDMNIKNTKVIILWNHTDSPGISTELRNALNVIDDITAVGSDTFMFCPHNNYVIEFYHEGEITVGLNNEC
ncbi:hypothetical protein ERICIV_01725 [Paenibacillus larvae subsp. larvae]|uniref:Uncharacterized protein n=2 Tax=Paenibacillus larvae TaxID=1464 RepID=A0A1U9YRI0_9BACL|nr:hypothetical protein [Paenibacillus larvae]AQT86320.1 hypothetical protein B1222_20975 [Paenibacillus larvae subsp. pulvifaciens]AQZ47972.1 hypothetical protein B5S25_16635 [Paenibacillus larvae subsp. pulvifaciens]ARF66939.1 hypothetical protein B7C51_02645 [Paenibacillus larvae subsp. pulvifaciens]AVF25882.1 hypothetical protein ERICIII_01704 [Paenibacillus larvae subsp. larvae]AVF30659.1 hypothetical protein ERICIV_01725 [Paenibacillus larvae subsp. larvae]